MQTGPGEPSAGWYRDPWGEHLWRYWSPAEGWSATAVSGDLVGPSPAQQEPDAKRRWPLLVAVAAAMSLVVAIVGSLIRPTELPEWLAGRPHPEAPALPPGSVFVEPFEGSDSDAGWAGLRGSAFTTSVAEDRLATFYATEFPTEHGWREVPRWVDEDPEERAVTYRCRARPLAAAGEWEYVLLGTASEASGRSVVLRAEVSLASAADGFEANMEDCTYPMAWMPIPTIDWLYGNG